MEIHINVNIIIVLLYCCVLLLTVFFCFAGGCIVIKNLCGGYVILKMIHVVLLDVFCQINTHGPSWKC